MKYFSNKQAIINYPIEKLWKYKGKDIECYIY